MANTVNNNIDIANNTNNTNNKHNKSKNNNTSNDSDSSNNKTTEQSKTLDNKDFFSVLTSSTILLGFIDTTSLTNFFSVSDNDEYSLLKFSDRV